MSPEKKQLSYVTILNYIYEHIGIDDITVECLTKEYKFTDSQIRQALHKIPSIVSIDGLLRFSDGCDLQTFKEELAIVYGSMGVPNHTRPTNEAFQRGQKSGAIQGRFVQGHPIK